jgi:hypothetical protein
VVQPDFAHRHQARVVAVLLQGLAQRGPGRFGSTVHTQRVDAQRIGAAMRMGQRTHGVEVRHLHRRQHQVRITPAARRAAPRRAVGVELRCVQVAVGIDPHGAMMAQLCAVAPAVATAT